MRVGGGVGRKRARGGRRGVGKPRAKLKRGGGAGNTEFKRNIMGGRGGDGGRRAREGRSGVSRRRTKGERGRSGGAGGRASMG